MCPFQVARQLELIRTWGGRRTGAGRKPAPGRRAVPHRARPLHEGRCPVHVTMRATARLVSLRNDGTFVALRGALLAASNETFRVVHFSVQPDHVHLLVEADDHSSFRRGLQGFAIRAARAVNRALGRCGRVWSDRYHARILATPREVRNALVYVLANWKKHVRGARGLDPRSSAMWFRGWNIAMRDDRADGPVARARTWLMRVGWRRHGLIDMDEAPRRR